MRVILVESLAFVVEQGAPAAQVYAEILYDHHIAVITERKLS